MEFIINRAGDFKVSELVTDSDGAKITTGITLELRIIERNTWKLYDWDSGTFKASAVVDDEDTCTHKQAGGAYDTGIWENATAIDKDAFTADYVYIFEFYDATNAALISQREVQWSGNYGGVLVKAGDKMDLVNAPNSTAITAIQSGLSTFDASSDEVDIGAVKGVAVSGVNDFKANVSGLSTLSLTSEVDATGSKITLGDALKYIASFASGKSSRLGDAYTFYAKDGTTALFTLTITADTRTPS